MELESSVLGDFMNRGYAREARTAMSRLGSACLRGGACEGQRKGLGSQTGAEPKDLDPLSLGIEKLAVFQTDKVSFCFKNSLKD